MKILNTMGEDRTTAGSMGAVCLSMMKNAVMFVYPLRFVALGLLILVITDFKFGVELSKKKGIRVRPSRARRRTLNKIMDYICLVLIASIFQQLLITAKIDFPLFPLIAFIYIGYYELDSIINNRRELHDKSPVNLLKLIICFLKRRKIEDVINEVDNIDKKKNTKDDK